VPLDTRILTTSLSGRSAIYYTLLLQTTSLTCDGIHLQLTTLFIDPERMKSWFGLVGWPIADGLPTVSCIGRAQHRESSPVRDLRSTTVTYFCFIVVWTVRGWCRWGGFCDWRRQNVELCARRVWQTQQVASCVLAGTDLTISTEYCSDTCLLTTVQLARQW